MALVRPGTIGIDPSPSMDNGTSVLINTSSPGINIGPLDSYGHPVNEVKGIEDHWRREEEIKKSFFKVLRDSIINYEVDKRIDSLPRNMKNKIRSKKDGVITYVNKRHRALNKIDALVLHSTAGPERKLKQYYDFSVHFVITPDGTIYQLHDESVRCHGSSGFNRRSVAVEFVGHFKQDNGKWNKNNKLRHVPTKQQIESGRSLVKYLKRTLNIKYVLAHAQAANKNCPGPEIWYNVGEWAINNGFSANGTKIAVPGGKSIRSKCVIINGTLAIVY
jgi:hypothetical protein